MSVPRSVVAVIALVKPLSGVNSRVPVELPLVVGVVRAECARKPPFCEHVQLVYGLRAIRWSLVAGEDALPSFPMAVLLCWSIVTAGRSLSRPQRRRASNLVSRCAVVAASAAIVVVAVHDVALADDAASASASASTSCAYMTIPRDVRSRNARWSCSAHWQVRDANQCRRDRGLEAICANVL